MELAVSSATVQPAEAIRRIRLQAMLRAAKRDDDVRFGCSTSSSISENDSVDQSEDAHFGKEFATVLTVVESADLMAWLQQ